MEKLFYKKPYVKTFEAQVLDCRPEKTGFYEVILDRTAFYPEGGGQPADMGALGDVAVFDVKERAGEIFHITDSPIPAGSTIVGRIDWERRFQHMQNHSGEHIFSGVVHKHYGFDNVGFHMGKDEITVDFNGVLTWEQVESIEDEVNELIWENVPVLEYYPSREELASLDYRSKKEIEGQIRIIEVPGGDVCACCGTHVTAAGEIGLLKVTGMINYKGGVRISLLCGKMALSDYRKKQKTVSALSVLFSSKPDEVLCSAEKLKEESLKKDGTINEMYQELLQRKTTEYLNSENPLLVFEQGLAPVELRKFCTMLYEAGKGSVVLVCSGAGGTYQYAMGSSRLDMRMLGKRMNQKLNGKGGGSSNMVQGTFLADADAIRSVFEEEAEGEKNGFK